MIAWSRKELAVAFTGLLSYLIIAAILTFG